MPKLISLPPTERLKDFSIIDGRLHRRGKLMNNRTVYIDGLTYSTARLIHKIIHGVDPPLRKTAKRASYAASPAVRAIISIADRGPLSDNALEKRAGIYTNAISAWRRGITCPSVMTAETLGMALGYHLEWVKNEN